MGFWRQPQQVWFRRALFQIHLWTGVIVGLYIIVISVSGSAAVFRRDLNQAKLGNVPAAEAVGTKLTEAQLRELLTGVDGQYYPQGIPHDLVRPELQAGLYAEAAKELAPCLQDALRVIGLIAPGAGSKRREQRDRGEQRAADQGCGAGQN